MRLLGAVGIAFLMLVVLVIVFSLLFPDTPAVSAVGTILAIWAGVAFYRRGSKETPTAEATSGTGEPPA